MNSTPFSTLACLDSRLTVVNTRAKTAGMEVT